MKRVLHIMSGYGGGISSLIDNLASQAPQHDLIFDVVTYDDCSQSFYQKIQDTNGKVYGLKNPKKEGWKAFIASFEAVFQNHAYDLVHCHIAGYRAIPYAIIANRYQVPFIIHAHDTTGLAAKGWKAKMRESFNRRINRQLSSVYLGCGPEAIQDKFAVLPQNPSFILPNAIDPARFMIADSDFEMDKKQLRNQYGIDDDTIVFGQVGRLKEVKNHDFSLDLMAWLKAQDQKVKLIIVGSGPLEAELERKIKQTGLIDQVDLIGRVEPVESIYPLFDILLLPSFSEGFPTTLVESQAMGIPALVSDRVTPSVDLDLGLINYLDLSASKDQWWQAAKTLLKADRVALAQRMQALSGHALTLEAQGRVYAQLVKGRQTYQPGDIIDEKIS